MINLEFDFDKIKIVFIVVEGLCKWVVVMELYDK